MRWMHVWIVTTYFEEFKLIFKIVMDFNDLKADESETQAAGGRKRGYLEMVATTSSGGERRWREEQQPSRMSSARRKMLSPELEPSRLDSALETLVHGCEAPKKTPARHSGNHLISWIPIF